MSSRIVRAPKSQKSKGPEKAKGLVGKGKAKGKDGLASKKGAKGAEKGKGHEQKAGFESHSGKDVLLGEKAATPSMIRKSPKTKGKEGAEGKGLGKDGKGLVKGGPSKEGGKAGLKGKAEGKEALAQEKGPAKGGLASGKEGPAKGKEKGLLGGLKKQMTGIFDTVKAKVAKGAGKGEGPGQSAVADGAPAQASGAKGEGLAQTPSDASGPGAGDAGAPDAKGADGKTLAKGGDGLSAKASDGAKAADAPKEGKAADGAKGAGAAKEGSATQKSKGAAAAYNTRGASAKGDAAAQGGASTSRNTGSSSASSKALSLRSLHFQEVADTKSAKEKSADSPREQFRALLRKHASAQQLQILQQFHGVTPHDAAAVAKQIATLAQSGQLPINDLLGTLVKLLKRPGNRKKLDKIKDILVKKGVISAGISTETLELIAAMIALYLAKGENLEAEELIVELFNSSSRRLELPDEGGSHHEEGREEERHAEHARGDRSDPVDVVDVA